MSQVTPQSEKPSWLSRAFRFVVRFLFVVILGLIAGIGIYLGVTYLANRYFQSVQVNSQRIQAIEENQSLAESQAKQRLDDVISRLQSLETLGDSQKVFEADTQSRIAALETAQPAQANLQETLTADQAQIGTLQASLSRMQSTQQAIMLTQRSTDAMTAIQTLRADWSEIKTSIDSSHLEIQLLKTMELINRARFNLYQNNLGLARQDIQSARGVILAIQPLAPEDQLPTIEFILGRLDGALAKLPDQPVAASDEIEDAWNLLVSGTKNTTSDVTAAGATPRPGLTPGPSLTPTPSPTTKP